MARPKKQLQPTQEVNIALKGDGISMPSDMKDFSKDLIKDLNKELGSAVMFNLGDGNAPTVVHRWVSTGSKQLDYIIGNIQTIGGGLPEGRIIELQGPTGCHGKGDKVLMYDGSVKNIEDVLVGDKLIGPDSEPRTVLCLHRGKDSMFEYKPTRYGKTYHVTGNHTLVYSYLGEQVQETVNDWIKRDDLYKNSCYIVKSGPIKFNPDTHISLDQITSDMSLEEQVFIARKSGFYSEISDGLLITNNANVTFTLKHIGDCVDYYGITVDKDNLYLGEDFTVIKNCGKSHIAALAARNCQSMGGLVVYVDTENATSPENLARLGVDVKKNFAFAQCSCTEDVFKIIESTILKARQITADIPILVVWDSVANTSPKAELEGDYDQNTIGLQARVLGKGFRKITNLIGNQHVILLALQQQREKIGCVSPETIVEYKN